MNDLNWVWLFAWFCILAIGYVAKTQELKILGSILGIIAGFSFLNDSTLLTISLMLGNTAILFMVSTEKDNEK